MTVTVSKPQLNLREELSALKKKTGIKGEELLRSNTVADAYAVLNPVMFRNLLINGSFDIWQRGTSFSGGVYTADRWGCAGSGMSAIRVTNDCPGSTSPYAIQTTSESSGYGQMYQRIEGVYSTAGKQLTFSFWGKSSQVGTFRTAIFRDFGVGGSAQQVVIDAAFLSFTAANVWQYFTFTVLVPTLSGKTVGANSFVQIGMGGEGTSTSGRTFTWSDAQAEIGNIATPFERRPYGVELSLCHRYCQLFGRNAGIGNLAMVCGGSFVVRTSYTTLMYGPVQHIVPMRANPTVSWGGSLFGNRFGGGGYTTIAVSNVTVDQPGLYTTNLRIDSSSAFGNAGDVLNLVSDNAGTGYILLTAEL